MASMNASELKKEIKKLDLQIESLESSAKQSVRSVQDKTQWVNPLCSRMKSNPAPWVLGAVIAGMVLTQTLRKGSQRSVKSANVKSAKVKDATLLGLIGIELKRWAAKEAISYVKQAAARRSNMKIS